MGQHNQVLSEREVDSQALGSFEALRRKHVPYKDDRSCLLFINHTKRAFGTWYCRRNRCVTNILAHAQTFLLEYEDST